MDGLVILAAIILNPRAQKRRRRESMEEASNAADATIQPSTTITRAASACSSVKI